MNAIKTAKLAGGSSNTPADAILNGIKGWHGKCISASYSTVVWGDSDSIEAPIGASIIQTGEGSPEFFATYVVYFCELKQALELERHYRECCERGIRIKRGEVSPQQFGECNSPSSSYSCNPCKRSYWSRDGGGYYTPWELSNIKRGRLDGCYVHPSLRDENPYGWVHPPTNKIRQKVFMRPGIRRAQLPCQ